MNNISDVKIKIWKNRVSSLSFVARDVSSSSLFHSAHFRFFLLNKFNAIKRQVFLKQEYIHTHTMIMEWQQIYCWNKRCFPQSPFSFLHFSQWTNVSCRISFNFVYFSLGIRWVWFKKDIKKETDTRPCTRLGSKLIDLMR